MQRLYPKAGQRKLPIVKFRITIKPPKAGISKRWKRSY
jgi:hypothetical protein